MCLVEMRFLRFLIDAFYRFIYRLRTLYFIVFSEYRASVEQSRHGQNGIISKTVKNSSIKNLRERISIKHMNLLSTCFGPFKVLYLMIGHFCILLSTIVHTDSFELACTVHEKIKKNQLINYSKLKNC